MVTLFMDEKKTFWYFYNKLWLITFCQLLHRNHLIAINCYCCHMLWNKPNIILLRNSQEPHCGCHHILWNKLLIVPPRNMTSLIWWITIMLGDIGFLLKPISKHNQIFIELSLFCLELFFLDVYQHFIHITQIFFNIDQCFLGIVWHFF